MLKSINLEFRKEFSPLHHDLSAITYSPKDYLWVGSDETTTIERLSLDEGKFRQHKSFKLNDFLNLKEGKNQEIDIEGLAYDNYYLWIVGSYSCKRKNPSVDRSHEENIIRLNTIVIENNRYLLAKIPLVEGELYKKCPHPNNPKITLQASQLKTSNNKNILLQAIKNDPIFKPFMKGNIPSKDNGLDIEGIAVKENKVFLGLRGPVLRGWAIILELEIMASKKNKLKFKKCSKDNTIYKKHFVKLEGLGIRDLCIDKEGILILAGPTMDLDGPVKLFYLKNGCNLDENALSWKPRFLKDIPFGMGNHHAEGITIIENNMNQTYILVVYDSPSDETVLTECSGVVADIFNISI